MQSILGQLVESRWAIIAPFTQVPVYRVSAPVGFFPSLQRRIAQRLILPHPPIQTINNFSK